MHLMNKKSLKRIKEEDSLILEDITCIFGTTENAVYNQLFAALIAYVLLRFLYRETSIQWTCIRLSFIEFTRKLIIDILPVEAYIKLMSFLRAIQESLRDNMDFSG